MADQLEYVFHDVRYRFDYLLLRAKQRYYRIKNPRVISGRLKHTPLLSLRTIPQLEQQRVQSDQLRLLKRVEVPVDVDGREEEEEGGDDDDDYIGYDVHLLSSYNAKQVDSSDIISFGGEEKPMNQEPMNQYVAGVIETTPRKRDRLLDILKGINSPTHKPHFGSDLYTMDTTPAEVSVSQSKVMRNHQLRLAPEESNSPGQDMSTTGVMIKYEKAKENLPSVDIFAANLKEGREKYGNTIGTTPTIRRRRNLLPPSHSNPLEFTKDSLLVASNLTPYFDSGLLTMYANGSIWDDNEST